MSNKFTIRSKILEVPPRKLAASRALGFVRGKFFLYLWISHMYSTYITIHPKIFFILFCKILFWPRRFEGYLKT